MNGRWYVVHCKPREDLRAWENLERQGFQCYCPTVAVEKWRKGSKVLLTEPLFPRYLFIWLDDVSCDWYPIRSTRGVNQIVCVNGQPSPVQDHIIESIRDRLHHKPVSIPLLQPGARVRVTDGSFSNLEAVFVANDGAERVMLLMNLLHREQMLSFPLSSIAKAEPPFVVV
jgi:transcriptional antiterminator RfaH